VYQRCVTECDTNIKTFDMLPLVPRREVTVDSVQPLYGPIAGGTRVTISGQSLSVSTVTAVHIGQYILKPDTSRL